ncbi:hypothetical protein APSETT445_003230 [Aspergillus pseudonomiae]
MTTRMPTLDEVSVILENFWKFGKQIQRRQLDLPEYAASFVNYKALKKSRMKELYLHRAVEVQPCFNRDVLRDLSDRATTARLELEAWAEGENIHFDAARPVDRAVVVQPFGADEEDLDLQILQSATAGNLQTLREWTAKLQSSLDARERATRTFLAAISEFPDDVLAVLLESGLVDIYAEDDINERNCLHEAAISGRGFVFKSGLAAGVDISRSDVYGRLPLHYACIHGRVEMVKDLLAAGPHTVDVMDHDNFTPLIHSIVKGQLACAEQLLYHNARIDPASESDHIPLNLACQHGSLPIVELLLERHAQLLPDAEGLYPQHMVARASQSPQLLMMLKQHGADLNQKDKLYQWTPLFHAASEGCVDCLRALLELGVDADVVDEKGLAAIFADAILTVVFDHARVSREQNPEFMRSVVFTSYNPNICVALNWKQPNSYWYVSLPLYAHSRRFTPFSAHYALWPSTNTELLWLLQNVVPALVETIKELGLVLVADTSDEVEPSGHKEALGAANAMGVAEWAYRMPDGVNGVMKANGILRFNDMIDM